MAKNRCLKNFSSTIEYWRPSTKEYWTNHVPLFKKPLSSLVSLLETFVLMLTNFWLSEILGTSIFFLLFYFIYSNILDLYAHLLITHSSFHFQHSLPSCIQSIQHVYFHIDMNYIDVSTFIHCIYFPFHLFSFLPGLQNNIHSHMQHHADITHIIFNYLYLHYVIHSIKLIIFIISLYLDLSYISSFSLASRIYVFGVISFMDFRTLYILIYKHILIILILNNFIFIIIIYIILHSIIHIFLFILYSLFSLMSYC